MEDRPTWSPDGGRLAYASEQSGNWDIWVKQISGGEPVNLTADHSGRDDRPSWSPDGSQIAFRSSRDDGEVFVVPAIGGTPNKIVPNKMIQGPIRWSQDGTKLAYAAFESANRFAEIITIRTGETRRVPLPGSHFNRWWLNWSHDGETFAYVDVTSIYPEEQAASIWLLRLNDGSRWRVTDWLHYDFYPS